MANNPPPVQAANDRLDDLFNARDALPLLLDAIGRNSGALVIVLSGEVHHRVVDQNLPQEWVDQLQRPDSALLQAAYKAIQNGSNTESFYPENSAAILPIRSAKAAIGTLLVWGEPFSAEEVKILNRLISPLSQAIQSAYDRDQMQRRARQMAGLQSELTRLAFSGPAGPDFEAVQMALVHGACQVLNSEHCALILIDEPNDGWMISKSLGENSEWVYQISAVDGPGLVRQCLHTGQTLCVNVLESDPRYEPSCDGWGERSVRSFLCAPLVIHGQAFGALKLINHYPGDFDAYDQDLLSLLTVQVANIFQGIHTLQQLKVANADLEANRWELLGSRNTLRAIFDHLPAGMYIIDPDYRLAAVNRGRAQRVEQPPKALVGQICYQALFGRSSPCLECRVMETFMEARSTQRSERRYTGNEEASDWEINTYPILDEDERVIQAILLEQDVTERRRLESILTQSEKLAAIGQLAAGVAHEINNPLTAIIANAQILHRELPANSDLQESVDLISRAGARAAQVVRNLLDFARKEEYHLGLTDLNETVERALELVQHEILARGIRLEFAPDPDLPPMLASQDHLQSVWLNLLLNAIDSLDKSPGEIKITTRRMSGEIHVAVNDNGKGIPPDRLTRIFEPFYTTKAAGRGTGLGLSVTHRIVKQHGGRIGVESQLGSGSTFTVMLPVS